MDRILKTLIESYAEEFDEESTSRSETFESFSSYSILENQAGIDVNPQDHLLAGGNDIGIDAAAIIINGKNVTGKDEVDKIAEISPDMRIGFIFVQATTSDSISGQKLRNFGDGAKSILEENSRFKENEDVKDFRKLSEYVLNEYAIEATKRPFCYLFYAYSGSYSKDQNIQGKKSLIQDDLDSLNLLSEISVNIVDSSRLQKLYNQANRGIEEEVYFPKNVSIPNLSNVSEAFVGTIPASEYLSLIRNKQEEIDSRVFFDNVRSFQGMNDVNEDILSTLKEKGDKNNFPLLNNGVTLVSRSINRQGDRFKLIDYQIVNGCQTSYVINRADKEGVNMDFQVPIKIVSVDNEDLVNNIIQATNNQTEVQKEELLALSDFQKKLQDFYNSFGDSKDSRLYYERRSGEFDSKQGIENTRVISIRKQIKAFASVFLSKPHVASRYYGTLVDKIGEDIFLEEHSTWPYYTSSLCLYWLEFMARNSLIDRKFNKFRFHISHAFRIQFGGKSHPRLNSNQISKYCEKLIQELRDRDTAVQNLSNVVSKLKKMDIDFEDRTAAKNAELVKRVEVHFQTD